jgi:putative zinc finger protein
VVSCQQVLQELSNYIDNDVDTSLREKIENHLKTCRRCSVVLDTTRKTVRIYSDEGVLEVPSGYGQRLRSFFLKAAKNG